MRQLSWVAIIGMLTVLDIFGNCFASDTIRLGVAGAHSGEMASYGLPTVKAAELVIKDINANGGILGKQVRLMSEDDACKPEVAAETASKLVSGGANIVLGHICRDATKAAAGIYKNAKIILMSPSATTPELTQSGEYPNFFRTIASDDMQAKQEVEFVLHTLKLEKIAVLHDNRDYGKGLAEFAKKFLEQAKARNPKVEIVLFEGIAPGADDYSAIVRKIRQSDAQALIYGGCHSEASKLVMRMRQEKMTTVFVSDDGVKDDMFIKVAGKDAEGVYATGPKDASQNPMAVKAIRDYKDTYKSDPGAFYLNAYAATQALLNAIRNAGSTDYEAVVNALRTQDVETPIGKIRFDERGDAIGIGFSMYQVKNGAFVESK